MNGGLVFVTGGSGFIGSHVVRNLVRAGRPVRCLVRPTSRLDRIADLGCEFVRGNIEDRTSLCESIKGSSSIIHVAGLAVPDLFNSPQMMRVHVEGTRNILEAALTAGVRRMVYVSSTAAVGGSAGPLLHNEQNITPVQIQKQLIYVRAKLAAEQLCAEYNQRGMSVTIVNPAEVFGPNDNDRITAGTLIDFAKSNPVFVCDGGISVVHVEDTAGGIVQALDRGRPGERYVLSGENISVRRLAELTLELLQLRRPIITLPKPVILAVAFFGRRLRIPLPFNPEIVPLATSYWFMDNSKARRELGVEFRSARETLQSTVLWLRECGYVR